MLGSSFSNYIGSSTKLMVDLVRANFPALIRNCIWMGVGNTIYSSIQHPIHEAFWQYFLTRLREKHMLGLSLEESIGGISYRIWKFWSQFSISIWSVLKRRNPIEKYYQSWIKLAMQIGNYLRN